MPVTVSNCCSFPLCLIRTPRPPATATEVLSCAKVTNTNTTRESAHWASYNSCSQTKLGFPCTVFSKENWNTCFGYLLLGEKILCHTLLNIITYQPATENFLLQKYPSTFSFVLKIYTGKNLHFYTSSQRKNNAKLKQSLCSKSDIRKTQNSWYLFNTYCVPRVITQLFYSLFHSILLTTLRQSLLSFTLYRCGKNPKMLIISLRLRANKCQAKTQRYAKTGNIYWHGRKLIIYMTMIKKNMDQA